MWSKFRRAFRQSREREETTDRSRSRRSRLRSWLKGVAFGFIALPGRSFGRWKVNSLRVTPQALEIVVLPRGLAKNVHHEKAIIEQQPFSAGFAFAMNQVNM